MRYRAWCFTINNYTSKIETDLKHIQQLQSHMEYITWGREKGENGTKHLQGYFVLKNRKELPALKKMFKCQPHFEVRKGSHEQARAYCEKSDTKVPNGMEFLYGEEYHTKNEDKGKRSDLLAVKETIDRGATEEELWDSHFTEMVKFKNGLTYYASLKKKKRNFKTLVHVYYGPTGTGKTKQAFEEAGEDCFILSPGQNPKGGQLFFDGYIGQEHVILDEFYGSSMAWAQLLALTDRYPQRVMVKGSSMNWAPKQIWITSNEAPWQWFSCGGLYATLERRLDTIIQFVTMEQRIIIKTPNPINSEKEKEKSFLQVPEGNGQPRLEGEMEIPEKVYKIISIDPNIFGANGSQSDSTDNRSV